MSRLSALLVLLAACSSPNGPPQGDSTVVHLQNGAGEAVQLTYRPADGAGVWVLGVRPEVAAGSGRCIIVRTIGPTVLRIRGLASGREVRDSANLPASPDWVWDTNLDGAPVAGPLHAVAAICGNPGD